MQKFSAVMHSRFGFHRSALALVLLAGAQGAQAAGSIDSAYTRHDYERCHKLSDDDPIMERRCEGHAGIVMTWVSEPDSSSLSFGTEGAVGGEFDNRFTFAVAAMSSNGADRWKTAGSRPSRPSSATSSAAPSAVPASRSWSSIG